MKIERDNDIVRAVGWVTIQSSHLEAEIERVAAFLGWAFQRPDKHETEMASRKLKWIKSRITELNSSNLSEFSANLEKASNLLDQRNKLVHGRIFFDDAFPERLIPSRTGLKETEIEPQEVYDLADKILNLHLAFLPGNSFKILAAMKEHINSGSTE